VKTIWKYPIYFGAQTTELDMPMGAKVIAAAMQDNVPTVWAWVDPERPVVRRRIAIVGTGLGAPEYDEAEHVATVLDGPFVWHVFDGGEAP
jgi:hypothetical protein